MQNNIIEYLVPLKNVSLLTIAKVLYDSLDNVPIFELFEKQVEIAANFLHDLNFPIDNQSIIEFSIHGHNEINKGFFF